MIKITDKATIEEYIPQKKETERPKALPANIYKIKSPKIGSAMYIAISKLKNKPYELFIYSKDLSKTAEFALLGRLVSAIFRAVKDPSFIIEELNALYDTSGGYFSNGKHMKSIYAEIGAIIQMELNPKESQQEDVSIKDYVPIKVETDSGISNCPECGEKAYVTENGCATCQSCGFSKCGG